jgi:hypothetical protein
MAKYILPGDDNHFLACIPRFLVGFSPLSEAANEVAIAATARNPESPGLTVTLAISESVLSTVFSFHNQHLPLQ